VDQIFSVFSRIHQFFKCRNNAIKKRYNAFLPFMVQIDAVRYDRKEVKLRLIWFAKDEQGLKSAYCEIQRHKAGRSARLAGMVEVIAGPVAVAVDFNADPQ
jgi:hypothetical protein